MKSNFGKVLLAGFTTNMTVVFFAVSWGTLASLVSSLLLTR